MSIRTERLIKLNKIAIQHHDRLFDIANDLVNMPIPDKQDVKASPYAMLPVLGGHLHSTLSHYEHDRNDSFEMYDYLIEMRFWRVANLVQILTKTLPLITPLYDANSKIHAKEYCNLYIPYSSNRWKSLWEETSKTHTNSETAEIVSRQIILNAIKELNLVYKDIKDGIGESTWDLQ